MRYLSSLRSAHNRFAWRIQAFLFVLLAVVPLSGAPARPAVEPISPAWSVDVESTAAPEGATYARVRDVVGGIELLQESDLLEKEVTLNPPVADGDVVSTGANSLLEIQLADGTLLRLGEFTQLAVVTLADWEARFENRTILGLAEGTLSVQLSAFDPEEKMIRVDTDAATIFFLTEGLFRIDVNAGGGTRVTSKRGVAEILAADASTLVRSGEMSFVAPGYEAEGPRVVSTRPRDSFDRYVEERRLAYLQEARGRTYARYEDDIPEPVRPYAVELDTYGTWRDHPTYGVIWVPRVAAGWRPYHHGYWHWRPVGWVWVSSDPWGYAPYHYGRWEHLSGYGWTWLPGAVYSPAWVSWGYYQDTIGWAPLGYYNYPTGWSISFSFGSFHGPHWSFVGFHNFHHRNVHTVIIKERHIVHNQVHYAPRPPDLRHRHIREQREAEILRRARSRATPVGSVRRNDPGDQERDFRRRERALRQVERRAGAVPPAAEQDTGRGGRSTDRGRELRDSPRRRTTPVRRTPAATRGRSTSPDRRTVEPRGRSVPESETRQPVTGRTGRDDASRGGRSTSRSPRAGARKPDSGGSSTPTLRRVGEDQPRRLLTGTRTRRAPESSRGQGAGGSSATSRTGPRERPERPERPDTRRRQRPSPAPDAGKDNKEEKQRRDNSRDSEARDRRSSPGVTARLGPSRSSAARARPGVAPRSTTSPARPAPSRAARASRSSPRPKASSRPSRSPGVSRSSPKSKASSRPSGSGAGNSSRRSGKGKDDKRSSSSRRR